MSPDHSFLHVAADFPFLYIYLLWLSCLAAPAFLRRSVLGLLAIRTWDVVLTHSGGMCTAGPEPMNVVPTSQTRCCLPTRCADILIRLPTYATAQGRESEISPRP